MLEQCAEDACKNCKAPGSCCRGLVLYPRKFPKNNWIDEVRQFLKVNSIEQFIPRGPHPVEALHDEQDYVSFVFDCSWLSSEGFCTNYENRPQLCRDYLPKLDPLCAEYVRGLRGIPIVVQK